jgi:hypothetical protein
MKNKIILFTILLNTFAVLDSMAQTMPLVCDVENIITGYPMPPYPSFNQLPIIQALPDPFEWADGSSRIKNYSDWQYRRVEIGAQIQNYEIGVKPVRPDTINASYSGGVLTVNVTVNGKTLALTSQVVLPTGTGPFPAVIGMNFPSGSLPSTIFSSRKIAQITFNHDQVTTYANLFTGRKPLNSDPYFQLYPAHNLDNTGQYSAWAWGVSRIIDGLELVQNILPIDLKHLCVTGCSYAGKMALFAGAFDERIALTIAQESGGGGATSWRYSHSEPSNSVEIIDNTDYNWFMNSMVQFAGNNVWRLPEDHHELMAMCAPRALFVTANPGWTWLSNPSCYVCSKGCQQVYNALGIGDRFGFSLIGPHDHCSVVPISQISEIEAFVDKFLLGNDTVNTNVATTPYDTDLSPWITWTAPALSNDSSFFEWTQLIDPSNLEKDMDKNITFKWHKVEGADKYLIQLSTDPAFANIIKSDSTTTDTVKTITGLLEGKRYYWRVRVENISGSSGPWSEVWNFTTYIPLPAMPQLVSATPYPGQPGWVTFEWNKTQYADYYLIQLAHVQDFTSLFYSDTTSDTVKTITGLGIGRMDYWRVQSKNLQGSSSWSESNFYVTDVEESKDGRIPTEYSLSQNYPNPFNPVTKLKFALPERSLTKLVIYDLLGREVRTLINKELEAGYHEYFFDAYSLPSGVYFYRFQAGTFTETKKLVLVK